MNPVFEASKAIKEILMQLERDTGQTVNSIEIDRIDITGIDTPHQYGKHVVISLDAKDGWL